MQLSRFIIRLDFPYDLSAVLLYPKIDSIIIQNVNLVIDNLNDEIYSLKFNIEMKVKATITSSTRCVMVYIFCLHIGRFLFYFFSRTTYYRVTVLQPSVGINIASRDR